MKRILALTLILNITIAFSQNELSEIRNLIDNEQYNRALSQLDELKNNEKIINNPVYWIYKGVVYHSLYNDDNTKISKDSLLNMAFSSYEKAKSLDVDKQYNKNILEAYGFLVNQFTYEGVQNFNNKNYNAAIKDFENSLSISSLPEFALTDSVLYYNIAMAAENAQNYEKAEDYYRKTINLKFGKSKPYLDLAKMYKKQQNIEKYEQTLKEGLQFYPDDKKLVEELINYYLSISDVDNALIYTRKAIKTDTTTSNLFFILGSLYESKHKLDSAKIAYKKAIEIKPNNSDALYNLGALYYNEAVKITKHANTKEEKQKAIEKYKEAVPYMEKVSEIEPTNKDVLVILKSAYRVIGDNAKKEEIQKKIDALN